MAQPGGKVLCGSSLPKVTKVMDSEVELETKHGNVLGHTQSQQTGMSSVRVMWSLWSSDSLHWLYL